MNMNDFDYLRHKIEKFLEKVKPGPFFNAVSRWCDWSDAFPADYINKFLHRVASK